MGRRGAGTAGGVRRHAANRISRVVSPFFACDERRTTTGFDPSARTGCSRVWMTHTYGVAVCGLRNTYGVRTCENRRAVSRKPSDPFVYLHNWLSNNKFVNISTYFCHLPTLQLLCLTLVRVTCLLYLGANPRTHPSSVPVRILYYVVSGTISRCIRASLDCLTPESPSCNVMGTSLDG
jgi:hypothetical protein